VLRAQFTRLLVAEGWAREEMTDVLLAVGELAANAVMHARTPFEVRFVVDGHVEVEVTDRDPQHLPLIRAPGDGRAGGFGSRIVDSVARRWDVEQNEDTKVVRAVFDRPVSTRDPPIEDHWSAL
jgi:anti-sigma regulatory factor (Ser/Thr protein kinase)